MTVSLEGIESDAPDWMMSIVSGRKMTRDVYRRFADANPELRIERNASGEVIIMPPAHARTGNRNFELVGQLCAWVRRDGTGEGFDSSSGFDLPNGSNRSPDASWVLKSRIEKLTQAERDGYMPLCPDFVIELRSASDRLAMLQEKMEEYIANGARLGWLIDPFERRLHVYRPGAPAQVLDNPTTVDAGPELPGFVLDLDPIWNPGV